MRRISFSDGVVKINNVEVDGILTSLSIDGEVNFDTKAKDGLSGTQKVPMGWSDMDVSLSMDLITDDETTCYEKLENINDVFRSRDNSAKMFEISNKHLSARGVKEIYFSKLSSSESDQDDVISVSISFVEYIPAVTKDETSLASGNDASKNVQIKMTDNNGKPVVNKNIIGDDDEKVIVVNAGND